MHVVVKWNYYIFEKPATLKVTTINMCNIITYGAPNMTGENLDFVESLIKTILEIMLSFYTVLKIKMPCVIFIKYEN